MLTFLLRRKSQPTDLGPDPLAIRDLWLRPELQAVMQRAAEREDQETAGSDRLEFSRPGLCRFRRRPAGSVRPV